MTVPVPESEPQASPWIVDEPLAPFTRVDVYAIPEIGVYTSSNEGDVTKSANLTKIAFAIFAERTGIGETPPEIDELQRYHFLAVNLRKNPSTRVVDPWNLLKEQLAEYQNRSPLYIIDAIARFKNLFEHPKNAAIVTRLVIAQSLGTLPDELIEHSDWLSSQNTKGRSAGQRRKI